MRSGLTEPVGDRDGGVRVSIIIPTLDEESHIGKLLRHLRSSFPGTEVIVADGGSTDATLSESEGLVTIVRSKKGRAFQMNRGAKDASGSVLWFLHADCWPTARSLELIKACLRDPNVIGGAFRWAIDSKSWFARLCTDAAFRKNRRKRNLFGDMGIFLRREVFEELGGFAELPLFEDADLSDRMKKVGETVVLDEILLSSDRRYRKFGLFLSFAGNDILKIAYGVGFSPHYMAGFYWK